ncbi:Virginiamycin B lyase [Methylobacterium mesophilicum]|nr:Virginiamycin B lyase [Methylobacterium mesophilicum]
MSLRGFRKSVLRFCDTNLRRHLKCGQAAFVAGLALTATYARAEQAREAIVTTQLGGAVEIVDLAAGKVVRSIKLDGAPAGIALSPDRKRAYVTRPEGHGLAVLDLDAGVVAAEVPLPGGPLGVAADPRGGKVYVADWYGNRLFVLTERDGRLIPDGEIAVGASPSGIAVSPDGATLYVANREADTVSVVDADARKETKVIPVGQHPFGITLDAPTGRAYTANVTSDDVSVIDLAAGREIGRIPTGRRPYVIALTQGRGFVTDQYAGSVTAFDLTTLKPLADIDVGDHPEGIAADAGGRLYVANWGDNTLSVLDGRTLKVLKTIPTGNGPRAFGDFLR